MQSLIKEIQNSGLFDAEWYLKQYPDVEKNNLSPLDHYLEYGWKMGRNPSSEFDTNYYLKSNSDVTAAGINPLLHFIQNGKKEGRISKTTRVLSENSVVKNELAQLNHDYAGRIKKNELGYLLEYAGFLRKTGCLESYVGVIKYLTLHHDQFIERLQNILNTHIKNVLLLTDDIELLSYFINEKIELLFKLDFPKSKMASWLELPIDVSGYKQINKNAIFDLQNNDKIIDLLMDNSELMTKNIELKMLMANGYARKGDSARYGAIVGSYLNQEGCNINFSLRYFAENSLSKVDIKAKHEKWTDLGKVSIIMSAYNSEETIVYAITSLLNQTYKNIEILVCEDNSTDNTLNIAKAVADRDSRVKVFSSSNNQGTYNIRNHMIERAEGKYITFQDSDDFALPTRIQSQVEAINNSNATLCFCRWIRIMPDGQFVYFVDGILKRFCVVSAMVTTKYMKSISKFRQSLVAADTEFYEYCKNSLPTEQIVHLDNPLILGLWGSGSLTKMANLNAEHTGYVAPRRLAYSEISAKQRLLGDEIITDQIVDGKLKEINIYMPESRVTEY
ncbi:glycosyltransferase family 2 protein [Shewanella sp. NIFS-20-20]|uniref:glycosyltransferase family 2 protein n=1 Tax=Shewanella sp. NIFS-20-20 TaxID=2853806 RepID=UPI001C441C37|nr:glycosyltransferase family 2 protein [Shewanella sp. NIFS-20-20]MBV7316766.1 glycosyltransferase [Shewanella sp. NIFS-20-20]